MAPTFGNDTQLHVIKLPHAFVSLLQDSVFTFPLDDTAGLLMFFCLSLTSEDEERGWCLHIPQSASRICALPGRSSWATHIHTHIVHSEEKLNAISTREGQTHLWILIRVWLTEVWVSCRAVVSSLPACLNVLNTPHYKDSVKQQSPSAGVSALLPTRHLVQVLLVPTGRHLTKPEWIFMQIELETYIIKNIGPATFLIEI